VQWIFAMIETVTAFLGLISAGIFLAHAFDGFSLEGLISARPPAFFQKADFEIFNEFGPVSRVAGVSCVTMTLCLTDSSR